MGSNRISPIPDSVHESASHGGLAAVLKGDLVALRTRSEPPGVGQASGDSPTQGSKGDALRASRADGVECDISSVFLGLLWAPRQT